MWAGQCLSTQFLTTPMQGKITFQRCCTQYSLLKPNFGSTCSHKQQQKQWQWQLRMTMAGPTIENLSLPIALGIRPKCSNRGIHEGGAEEDEAMSLPPSTCAMLGWLLLQTKWWQWWCDRQTKNPCNGFQLELTDNGDGGLFLLSRV